MDVPAPAIVTQQERLRALAHLKSTLCYCSSCGAPLRFASFSVHPCYRKAVELLGVYRARQTVRRLPSPPSAPVLLPMTPTLKRPRPPASEVIIQRNVQARTTEPTLSRHGGGDNHAWDVYDDLRDFGTFSFCFFPKFSS